MNKQQKTRLWGLRIAGILLLLGSSLIIWFRSQATDSRRFWDASRFKKHQNIYKMPGQWLDHENKSITLAKYKGKATLVAFVYMGCRLVCPRIIADLKKVDRELNKGSEKKVEFLVFLFEDARKEPEILKTFRKYYGVEQDHWHVLTTSPETLKTLTGEFSVLYTLNPERDGYTHSNFFAVIDKEGKVIREIRSIQSSQEGFVALVKEALPGRGFFPFF